jgi:hypothetical protein
MRLLRFGLWMVLFALGCTETPPNAGALRVDLFYATFRPGCITLTVQDKADPSHSQTQELMLGKDEALDKPPRSKTLRAAVFRKKEWSRNLVLTATAYERSCVPQPTGAVATQTVEAQVPEEGITAVSMDLRAQDLDDDGYVLRTDKGGSDCDDNDASVNPAAVEDCDGKDDNCSGDESDAPDAVAYYADVDKDGYGDPATGKQSCIQPTGTVTNGRDCNDADKMVHPDQAETLCDGRDENCQNGIDDSFSAGASCATAQGCMGAFVCTADHASSACVASEAPVQWYVDEDRDGQAGSPAGLGCTAPVPGAVKSHDDCDDSSPFVSSGDTERCDKLDNNCDGQVDESACTGVDWHTVAGTGSNEWRAVAAYAEGKAWVAGPGGALAHVDANSATPFTDCAGNWISAWASPTDGRVFLGSDDGKLATHAVNGVPACSSTVVDTKPGQASAINGMVGFTSNGTTTLFAVRSDGRIFRWSWPGTTAPVEVAQVAANLRSIHGTSPTNLLAVGAQTILLGTETRAFRVNADTSWAQESLPGSLPFAYLRQVRVIDDQLAYAVGDENVLLIRAHGSWKEAKRLTAEGGATANVVGLNAYGRSAIYVIGSDKHVYRFNDADWSPEQTVNWTPRAMDGVGPHDMWVAGSQGQILHWGH